MLLVRDDLLTELNIGGYGYKITGYTDGYIDEVFSEIADSCSDVYFDDLWSWARSNLEEIDATIKQNAEEYSDMMELILLAQHKYIVVKLWEHIDDILLFLAYNYIYKSLHIKTITEEELDKIKECCVGAENISDILDSIDDILDNDTAREYTEKHT